MSQSLRSLTTGQFACKFLALVLSVVTQVNGEGGCSFETPHELVINPEPPGLPLIVEMNILIVGLRDVPVSGGSFGVDI